jgi:hypothetical protein
MEMFQIPPAVPLTVRFCFACNRLPGLESLFLTIFFTDIPFPFYLMAICLTESASSSTGITNILALLIEKIRVNFPAFDGIGLRIID